MNLKKLFLTSALLCSGCVVSSSPEDVPVPANTPTLGNFAGCYQNMVRTTTNGPLHYLSMTIWPDQTINHGAIEAIRVVSPDSDTLKVSAFANHQVVKEQSFISGVDFEFRDGQILLPEKLEGSGAGEPGNVFIGAMHTSRLIGLDQQGQGYLQESTSFAGTAFLVIPVAGQVNEAFRFATSERLCDNE